MVFSRQGMIIFLLIWGFIAPVWAQDPVCYNDYGDITACPKSSDHGDAVFRDNAEGTVTDLATGLIWQKNDDSRPRTWQESADYCTGLDLGGHTGWRMPALKELMSVTEDGRSQNIMNVVFIYRTGNYWTATPHKSDNNSAATIGYNSVDSNAYPKDTQQYVRCVSMGK